MKNLKKILMMTFSSSFALLVGCASPQATIVDIAYDYDESYKLIDENGINYQGGIYSAGTELTLFEDMKARRVGDILTVLLIEQTSGQNSSDSSLNQSTGMNVSAPTFGGSLRPNMEINLNSANVFAGESGSRQSNSLSGSIAVTVRQILPNGNLVIQGEKNIKINQGNEYIRLRGVIRQKDIDTYNTLYSTQIADAQITYAGRGTNSEVNNPGWAAKILFSSLWPF